MINLDLISFELTYKDKDSFGFVKFDQKISNKIDNAFNLIKASASELCMNTSNVGRKLGYIKPL